MDLVETSGLSAMLEFAFWKKVLYHSHNESYPDTKERVGYFLGVSENCGDAPTFYVLTEDEKILSSSIPLKGES